MNDGGKYAISLFHNFLITKFRTMRTENVINNYKIRNNDISVVVIVLRQTNNYIQ